MFIMSYFKKWDDCYLGLCKYHDPFVKLLNCVLNMNVCNLGLLIKLNGKKLIWMELNLICKRVMDICL